MTVSFRIVISEHEIPIAGGIHKPRNVQKTVSKLGDGPSKEESDLNWRSSTCTTKERGKQVVQVAILESKTEHCK